MSTDCSRADHSESVAVYFGDNRLLVLCFAGRHTMMPHNTSCSLEGIRGIESKKTFRTSASREYLQALLLASAADIPDTIFAYEGLGGIVRYCRRPTPLVYWSARCEPSAVVCTFRCETLLRPITHLYPLLGALPMVARIDNTHGARRLAWNVSEKRKH